LNSDLSVDSADLEIFSTNYLERNWESVDWCLFYDATIAGENYEGIKTRYFKKHFTLLLSFIKSFSACDAEPYLLELENEPKGLYRIVESTDSSGDYYITDPTVGSIFIYDANLVLKAEIKGLHNPLGVAVDSLGYILVGNSGRGNIEIYDPADGDFLDEFGEGLVKMPNAITVDDLGNIYVTDSRQNTVLVFDEYYQLVRGIGRPGEGESELHFPVDAKIIGANIFVADQGHARIQVYDLDGNWVRNITFEGTPGQNCSWFTGVCEIPGTPEFKRIQALATDALGRLHVIDKLSATGLIFDSETGAYIDTYGEYGAEPGQLRIPMDVLSTTTDTVMVIAGAGERIEFFPIQQ
jgi:DNA-binding beta-propeller fold protein YncE